MDAEPLVSVLTPVYNGAAWVEECIKSVLAQTYTNWEYIIVNNHSTDGTLEIAERYAQLDSRVRVHSNETLLDIIANHNRAFRLISASSKYCKIVSADDWLFPECLARMVALGEANPTVGIIGSYQLSGGGTDWNGWCVKWDQVPYPSTVVPGREVCRMQMLGGPYVFGTPTSILYRSDLVWKQDSFYPNSYSEADTSACYKCLQKSDFGFVHQILSYERDQHVRTTTRSQSLNAYLPARIYDILEYGKSFFSDRERERRLKELMDEYYEYLAWSALKRRESQFWTYHKGRLVELGFPLDKVRLGKAICGSLINLSLNPKQAVERLLKRWRYPRRNP